MPPVPQNAPVAPPTGLDPDAVNLAKSIRQIESASNFTAQGKSGEFGAYQYTRPTWDSWSKQHLGRPVALEQATPSEQNEVAYKQIKTWKDKGYNVGQIASLWNSGKPDKFEGSFQGVNAHGVEYNTPDYSRRVAETYQAMKGGAAPEQPEPPVGVDQPAPPSFFGNLAQDFARRGQNMADAGARETSGQQGILSTGLQDLGQVAGGVGDILFEALGAADRILTGGTVGKVLGGALEGIAATEPVQALAKGYQGFKESHPEAAYNLEAVGNIASVLPIGKGAQLGARGVAAGASRVVESDLAQKAGQAAIKDVRGNLQEVLSGTKPLARAYDHMVSRGFAPDRVLAERKLIPDIIDGKINVAEDSVIMKTLEKEAGEKATTLDTALGKYRTTITDAELRQVVHDEISTNLDFRQQGRVPEMQEKASKVIESYVAQEGKNRFRLLDVQDMKRGQASLSSMYRKALDFGKADEHSAVASALRKVIEEHASEVSVRKLNRQIGELEETMNLLTRANGTAVRGGRLGRYGARILGATIGSEGHIPIISPIIGAFLGDAIVTGIQKAKIAGPINRLLMKIANVAPDNKVVQETLAFVEAVESGQKVMPSDDVAEFLARVTAQANIPLLPEGVSKEFRSIVESGPTINLPEKTVSTRDAVERANPAIQPPKGISPGPTPSPQSGPQ